MFSNSIVKQATDAARRALLWSFAGGAAILCVFVAERYLFEDPQAAARSNALYAVVALLSAVGAVFLWRGLTRHLRRSEAAFLNAEERIRDLVVNDALTGVANRRALRDYLSAALDAAGAVSGKLAVVMIDLDHFLTVNERHGHVAGDLVLKEVSQRVLQSLRDGQLLARYGGDQFVAVLEFDGNDETVRRLGSRIIERVSMPISFGNVSIQIGASVGVALSPLHGLVDEELLRKADIAVRRAKEEGRGVCRVFDASMDMAVDEKKALREELRAAVKNGDLAAYFQPVVSLADNSISGFEILCRWQHSTRGAIAPEVFIPLAEEAGFTNALTMSVLKSACKGARDLPPHMFLALNVAPQQIQDEWLVEKILRVLTEMGLAPGRLEIELTESALVSDLAAAKRVITSLKNVGMSVSLDDFGTGYSSLCYLSELPFDKIKIDRSFIQTLTERDHSAKIVNAIVSLGRSLGVPIVAEGVENATDAEFLKDIGCSSAQGFYYAKPMSAQDLAAFLKTTTLKIAAPAEGSMGARMAGRQRTKALDVDDDDSRVAEARR